MSDKSCPINQCKRTNMYMDSQGIMRANKDLVKNYIPTPLPTLVGKPERITALDVRIAADEAELTPSEKVYTITYNANDGTGAPSAQTKVEGTTLTLSSTTPTRTGYTFNSWNTRANGSGTSYAPGATYAIDGNATLYAQWTINTYTITYNANEGTGAPANQTKTYGTDLTLSATVPTRAGYTFTGWNTAANGSGTSYAAGGTYSANEAATLYAQWTLTTYTVSFDANGGTGTMADVTGVLGSYELPACTFTAPATKEFKAWSVGGTEKAVGVAIEITADTTITAVWQDA